MTTTAEKLFETAKDMPEPLVAELLDFAEFLRAKKQLMQPRTAPGLLADLKGGLEQSAAFAADPLTIQRSLRDEWR